jgi:hypothetical protein
MSEAQPGCHASKEKVMFWHLEPSIDDAAIHDL